MVFPTPENITGLVGMFQYANDVTDNIYGVGILIGLYLIVLIFLNTRGEEITGAAVAAGFITLFPAIFLFLAGIISDYYLYAMIMLFIVSLLWAYFNKD